MGRLVMKHLQTLLILILAVALGALYVSSRRSEDSLKRTIISLESKIRQSDDECETKIAYLKAGQVRKAQELQPLSQAEKPLGELIGKISSESAKKRDETVIEICGKLGLNADQERRFINILDDFRNAKRAIGARAKAEKKPLFDTRYLNMLNEARSETMEKIRTVLGEDLYKKMIEGGYDLRLDLRSRNQRMPGRH